MLVEMILYHSAQTTCPGKFWFLSYGLKSSRPIRLLNYFFRLWQRTTLRNFLNFYMMIVEMILYHYVQIACPGKSWFLSYGPKSSWPVRLLDYFFRLWQRTTLRNFLNFYIMIVEMILYLHGQTACPGNYWLMRLGALLSTTQSNICSNCLIILIQYDRKVLYVFKYSIH